LEIWHVYAVSALLARVKTILRAFVTGTTQCWNIIASIST